MHGHGKEIVAFDADVLEDTCEAWIRIANYKFLASHNWYDSAKPTILVPSCPQWNSLTPLSKFQRTQADNSLTRTLTAARNRHTHRSSNPF